KQTKPRPRRRPPRSSGPPGPSASAAAAPQRPLPPLPSPLRPHRTPPPPARRSKATSSSVPPPRVGVVPPKSSPRSLSSNSHPFEIHSSIHRDNTKIVHTTEIIMGRSSLGSVGTDFASSKWLSLDPCGLLCLTSSLSLHLFSLVAGGTTLISNHLLAQILYGCLYVPFAILALWSLFAAATTDPGAVPLGARPLPAHLAGESDSIQTERSERGGLRRRRGIRRCRKCDDNYKPPRAHHDSVTGRCVVKMDHYCPWVGNAVGIRNHKFFILFILYTFLTSIVSFALILMRVIRCEYYVPPGATARSVEAQREHHCNSNHSTVVFVLGVITVLFFFFTFCMLLEQTEAVSTNVSKIARMKTRAGMVERPDEYAPVATEFNEVFGGTSPNPTWRWFLPLEVKFPEWAADNVLGYEWDPTFDPVPYQEPAAEASDGDSVSAGGSSVSGSLGGRTSEGGGAGLGSGGADDRDGLGPGGMDVETGTLMGGGGGGGVLPEQEPLEQELLREEEREVLVPPSSSRSEAAGIKKRSSGSFA
ncbi:hypothetical protein ACHAWF_010190, partial [Thalassiosira exigua]